MNALQKVAAGSIMDQVAEKGITTAEAIAGARYLVLLDQSGSMENCDARGGRSRYAVAGEELLRIQAAWPGQILLVEFADEVRFRLNGISTGRTDGDIGGGTNLVGALEAIRMADGILEIIVVSDGEPSDAAGALAVAAGFRSAIHTIYIGRQGGEGELFLSRLSAANRRGGSRFVAPKPGELASGIIALLGSG